MLTPIPRLLRRFLRAGWRRRRVAWRVTLPALAAAVALAARHPLAVSAGGGAENVLVIVDPANPTSLTVAQYYQTARGIPASNILYMPAGADDYPALAAYQLPALLGEIASRGLDDHIDYIVIAPGAPFYVAAPGLIQPSGCGNIPVRRIAIGSAYTLAFEREAVLGGLSYSEKNGYASPKDAAVAFHSNLHWSSGEPTNDEAAPRYFIGQLLGYSGQRGNSVAEIESMIDRSVAADGTQPDGTFYLMKTSDRIRSGTRDFAFPGVVASLEALGARAEIVEGNLPIGRHDALGVMSGFASAAVATADMTLLPGAFADHLTSYAATFDNGGQTKMSEWIRIGASGTAGTIEEPCAVPGKFPHPAIYIWYAQGYSLGEALFRSLSYAPFQTLMLGDPITRPFAAIPTVSLPDAPTTPVTGTLRLHPIAAAVPPATVARLDVLVDGTVRATGAPGDPLEFDTRALADGPHALRVVARDDSRQENQGEWRGSVTVADGGSAPTLVADPPSGTLATAFRFYLQPGVADASEVRLVRNGRVLAAAGPEVAAGDGDLEVLGTVLGEGTARVAAEVDGADGRRIVSAPIEVAVTGGEASDPPPPLTADAFTRDLVPGLAALIDPATNDPGAQVSVRAPAAQASAMAQGGTVLVTADDTAHGADQLGLDLVRGDETVPVTLTLRYCQLPEDVQAPSSMRICPGSATIEVHAQGENLTYRWFIDGEPVAGSSPRLQLDDLRPGQGLRVEAEVQHWCGNAVARERVSVGIVVRSDPTACEPHIYLPFARQP